MPLNDHIVLNPGTGGATLATDYVGGAHYQLNQLVYGPDNGSKTMISKTASGALPTTILMPENFFVPVSGSTNGASPVEVAITGGFTLSIGSVIVTGGTLDKITDGVTCYIASAHGTTIGVVGHAGGVSPVSVAATFGTLDVGGTVGIGAIVIPGPAGITVAQQTVGNTAVGLPDRTFQTGFKIKNYGSATTFVGPTMGGSITMDGYPLTQYDEIFIEATGSSGIFTRTITGTSDLRIFGS
jgi:hypothetical protein